MLRRFVYLCCLGSLCALVGCSADDDFIVSVNGKRLTSEMVERRASMMVAYRAKCGYKLKANDRKKFLTGLRSSYPKVFVANTILNEYIESEKLTVPAEHVQKTQQLAMKSFQGKRPKSWEDALAAMGEWAAEFDDQVFCEARRTYLRNYWAGQNPTNVTPALISNVLQHVDNVNAIADATNRLAFVRATNVWERLKSGADFRETAKKWSDLKQERHDGGEWARLDWQQMADDRELIKYARKLNPGEFSPPIEADNGLMILRVDKKDEKECQMSRIFFSLAMNFKRPSEKEIVADVEKKHMEAEFKRRYDELLKKADVVWAPKKAKPKASEKKQKATGKKQKARREPPM